MNIFKISIIIVNWNSGDQLHKCLSSLSLEYENELFEVIVVDNNSIDNSIILSNKEYPFKIEYILLDKNIGFGKACNLAAKKAQGKYVLLLNPDTIMSEKVISKSYKFIESRNDVDILGIQLHNNGLIQRSCCRHPNFFNILWTTIGLAKIFPKFFKGFNYLDWDHKQSRYVGHVIGAFYMLETKIYNELKGFDEDFFLYYEDLDLSYRAHKLNKKIYFNADLSIFHESGGRSNEQ